MDLNKLKSLLKDEPGYRMIQAEKALYQDLAEDWSEVSCLPAALRNMLNREFPIGLAGSSLPPGPNSTSRQGRSDVQ